MWESAHYFSQRSRTLSSNKLLPLQQISYQVCAQGSPSPPSILVPLQRLVPKISVLNRAPRPPTLANSGGPNPLKLCSLRRAWSLQTPDFLTRPQLLRLEISAEFRSIRPSSPSSQTLLSSRCSTCTSANFTETPSLQRIHPNPQLRAPLYFSPLQFFLRIAFFFFLFCSFSPSYSLSSTSLTIYLVASFSSRSDPPPNLPDTFRGAEISNRSVLYLSPLLRRSPLDALPPDSPRPEKNVSASLQAKPRPLQVYWSLPPKVPPPELPAPPPCSAALVFIPPVTRGSGKPEVGGAGRGRKVKGTERLSFLRLTGFSTALRRRCIVGSRRRA